MLQALELGDNNNKFIIEDNGNIASWIVRDQQVLDLQRKSGFEVIDEMTGECDFITGQAVSHDGKIVFTGKSDKLDLDLTAAFSEFNKAVKVNCVVKGHDDRDRALSVKFHLKIKSDAWIFGNSWLGQKMSQYPQLGETVSQVDPFAGQRQSQIPLMSLDNGSQMLVVAHSMRKNRFFSYEYVRDQADKGELLLTVTLGLAKETEKFPNTADFEFVLIGGAGGDGLRGAFAEYYNVFPECFVNPVPRGEGAWTLWTPKDLVNDIAELGFSVAQHEIEYTNGDGGYNPDVKNGEWVKALSDSPLLVSQYTEPWGYWVPLPKGWGLRNQIAGTKGFVDNFLLNTRKYRKEILAQYVGKTDEESDRFPGLSKDFIAKAIENTAIWRTPGGEWCFDCNFANAFGWGEFKDNRCDATIIIADSNPDLPSPNRWDVTMNQIEYAKKIADSVGAKIDVIYTDSLLFMLGWNEYDFQRAHWKYTNVPLTFTEFNGKKVPVANMALSNVQFLQKYYDYCRKNGYYTMNNTWSPIVQYSIAYYDIIGAGEHWDQTSLPPLADFRTIRLLANQKPVSHLDYLISADGFPMEKSLDRTNYALLYGFYPGTANSWTPEFIEKVRPLCEKYMPLVRMLNTAGWEVLTRTDIAGENSDQVLFERWGTTVLTGLFYTVRNISDKATTVTLSFDPNKFPLAKAKKNMHEPVGGSQLQGGASINVKEAMEFVFGIPIETKVIDGKVHLTFEAPANQTLLIQVR